MLLWKACCQLVLNLHCAFCGPRVHKRNWRAIILFKTSFKPEELDIKSEHF